MTELFHAVPSVNWGVVDIECSSYDPTTWWE